MNRNTVKRPIHLAFIGSAGIPNRYGGFEAFLEHCGPAMMTLVTSVCVTCDARIYTDHSGGFQGIERRFVGVPANGAWSVLHDMVAFMLVFRASSHIAVLGVSGGLWFPLFRALCDVTGKRLLVNVDGVEWRRTKYSVVRRWLLRIFDALAQYFSHTIVYDNPALRQYILSSCVQKSVQIGYSGDHVVRLRDVEREKCTALTICRIEPENSIEMLIEGALASKLKRYTIVGNWTHSAYGQQIKARYSSEPRLRLLDAIYDAQRLAELRESCDTYLHGHTVGGTNPSLVEMLFYDCQLLCFDVVFNRETAGDFAQYFSTSRELASALSNKDGVAQQDRGSVRARFSRKSIAAQYLAALHQQLDRHLSTG